MKRAGVVVVVMASALWGQTFEVASVRPRDPASNPMMNCQGGPGTQDPLHYTCTNVPIAYLAQVAYSENFQTMDVPEWTSTTLEGFNLRAVLPEGATKEQFQEMLRNLLEERFHLKWHRENRDVQTYVLSVLEPKIQASKPTTVRSLKMNYEGLIHIEGRRLPIQYLTDQLYVLLQARVVDETGLTGEFDYDVEFVSPTLTDAQIDGPTVFTALREKMGLGLKATKRSTPIFVIDRVDRNPTEN
jgi:uncharacterized protein (TIGR03435 family)